LSKQKTSLYLHSSFSFSSAGSSLSQRLKVGETYKQHNQMKKHWYIVLMVKDLLFPHSETASGFMLAKANILQLSNLHVIKHEISKERSTKT